MIETTAMNVRVIRSLIVFLAGLAGAAGVALGAAAAHRVDDPGLATAAQMLVLHAAAAVAVAAHLRTVHERPMRGSTVWIAAAVLLIGGALLFAGDIALRGFTGNRLFPMAAPIGGSTMIGGWVVLAIAALAGLRRGRK